MRRHGHACTCRAPLARRALKTSWNCLNGLGWTHKAASPAMRGDLGPRYCFAVAGGEQRQQICGWSSQYKAFVVYRNVSIIYMRVTWPVNADSRTRINSSSCMWVTAIGLRHNLATWHDTSLMDQLPGTIAPYTTSKQGRRGARHPWQLPLRPPVIHKST